MIRRSTEMATRVSNSRLIAMKLHASLGAALALAGCTVGPNFTPPTVTTPPPATLAAAQAILPAAATVDAAWWHAFDDPLLDEIEARALSGNMDLAEAGMRIGQARAALRIAGAAGLPQVGAPASYQRERDPFGTTTSSGGDSLSAFNLFQTGFDASWELDLWGKARRTREAAQADAQAAFFDQEAARISLSAEVARTYIRLRNAEARLAILRDNHKAVATGARIAAERLNHGASTRFDAATANTQLAAIDATLPVAEREAAEARNALALLAGEEPHALDAILAQAMPKVPDSAAHLAASLPSDLARHRPDIRSAEAALHAATARIGVAKANFYPSLSLGGSASLQSLTMSDLPLWSARKFVVGPTLQLPIFEGGRLKGHLDLARTDQQIAAIRYRSTVLRAWHEIDDAIKALRTAEAQVAAARTGVEQSRVAAHVAERRYTAGATGYIDVLITERARLDREVELVTARTARAIAVTILYKALGGGWVPPSSMDAGA